MTTRKNPDILTDLRNWNKKARLGATAKVRELARLIGKLSATRAQTEEASLYLVRLNRLKCGAVAMNGWDTTVTITRNVLPEVMWWIRTIQRGEPNNMQDTSLTGYGAEFVGPWTAQRIRFGWWTPRQAAMANCLRELEVIRIVIKWGLQDGSLNS
jgi:hypothetical protein